MYIDNRAKQSPSSALPVNMQHSQDLQESHSPVSTVKGRQTVLKHHKHAETSMTFGVVLLGIMFNVAAYSVVTIHFHLNIDEPRVSKWLICWLGSITVVWNI